MQTAPTGPDVGKIRDNIIAGRFEDASGDLDELLDADADNLELLYMRAVCHRCTKQFRQAHEVLARLKALAPDHGRAYQEEGHCYRDMGQADQALLAYALATRFNPALEASWREQHTILLKKGLAQEANQVQVQLDYLRRLPRPLVGVIDLLAQGKLLKAEDICRQFLQKAPHHVEAMRLLADIGIRLGALDDAEFLLNGARQFEPDNIRVRIDYIQALRKRQKFARALDESAQLLQIAPENPQFQSIYAIESLQNGHYDTALSMFDKILARLPGDPVTLTSKGHACKTSGEYENAVDAYRAAIASAPHHGEAYYALANLKVYSFSDDEIASMKAQEGNHNLSHMDRVYLSFALAKANEDDGNFEASFGYYAAGNRLKKSQSRYRASRMTEDLRSQAKVCTTDFFSSKAGSGHDAPDPIFIVGLPRAGSTLLEQILSSHSQVDGTLELPDILSLAQTLRRRARTRGEVTYAAELQAIPEHELVSFGRQYIEDTRIHRRDAPFFIDKMPNNFRHIGLIHLILPNAKIIDARREPMACCVSAFRQLFAEGQEFSYDLADLGQYYRDYVELMDHWDAVLPGKILRVQYEDVVADLETQVDRILQHCGLAFEPGCVEFHRTKRPVRTPSSEQVRQPIFSTGLEYWRDYEPWLGPLKDALGPDILDRYHISQSTTSPWAVK